MVGGAEQAGSPPDSVAPQLFNRPARNFRSRVTDLTPDDLFPSTKRTLQLDDGEGDDSRREDSRRAFPPCSSSPSAGSCRIDRGHCRASACSPGLYDVELSPVALKRARTARALGSSALARSLSREPRAAVGRGKLDGLKSIISIGSKNPELYYSTLYGKEMAREAVNTRSN